jgi:DNA invertase Pin-like site-specific DNA recombinase
MTRKTARRFRVIWHTLEMSLRVATYCRVSTDRQTTEHQRPEVEQLARQRGAIVATYEERASSKKARPEYARMLKDARRGMFDVVVIWAIDRLGRSMVGNMQDIAELDRVGVRVVSVKEAWMDTSGPTRPLLIAIASWMAETEHGRIVERIHAGLATARRQGKRLGRKPTRVDLGEVAFLRGSGLSIRATALKMGLTLSTLQRAIERDADPKRVRKAAQRSA